MHAPKHIILKTVSLAIILMMLIACKSDTNQEGIVKETKISEANSKTVEMLQGTWINLQDTLSTISFHGKTSKNAYNGIDTGRNIFFTIDSNCSATPSVTASETDRFINTSGDANECYYIETLSEKKLALKLVAQNITLHFKRQ